MLHSLNCPKNNFQSQAQVVLCGQTVQTTILYKISIIRKQTYPSTNCDHQRIFTSIDLVMYSKIVVISETILLIDFKRTEKYRFSTFCFLRAKTLDNQIACSVPQIYLILLMKINIFSLISKKLLPKSLKLC